MSTRTETLEVDEGVVIDEISMVCGNLVQRLHEIAGILRGSEECLRGIQLIASGDSSSSLHRTSGSVRGLSKRRSGRGAIWGELMSVYRQHEDELLAALRDVRSGRMTEAGAATYSKRMVDHGHPTAMGVQMHTEDTK